MSEIPIQQMDALRGDTEELAINRAIVKVHSRCNLDCDYCYVYNLGDESWREQPRLMSDETVETFAGRLAEYVNPREPFEFHITFHGGEPLLAPPEFFDRTMKTLRSAVSSRTVLQCNVQTNGTLLTEEYLDVFRRNTIKVGISLDGDKEANDRHRVDSKGRSSYDKVVENIARMRDDQRYSRLYEGILTVVDIDNDPVQTYRTLRELNPPSIDFLLPHGNWASPPPGLETISGRSFTPYAIWLGKIFNEWFPDDTTGIQIETFNSIMHMLTKGHSGSEALGGGTGKGLAVIETDGSYELVDTLKATPGRVFKTGKNIYRHSFATAGEYMAKRAQKLGITVLSEVCQQCPVVEQCGGGYAPHRYSQERGFDNRSIYCLDLARLIARVRGGLVESAFMGKVVDAIAAHEPEGRLELWPVDLSLEAAAKLAAGPSINPEPNS